MKKKNIYINWIDSNDFIYNLNEHYFNLISISKYSKKYNIIEDPNHADLILIICERFEKGFKNIFENRIINQFPNKSFLFSLSDYSGQHIIRGIYASAHQSFITNGRIISSSYTVFSDKFKNPLINSFNSDISDLRNYFISFLGRNSHSIREKILKMKFSREDIYISDTTEKLDIFMNKGNVSEMQKHYFDILSNSKFSLCPRGIGYSSIRLFESMKLGVAPIIISDNFVLPKGPLWKNFSIFIKEKEISNLETIVEEYESDFIEMGKLAKKAYDYYFADENYFDKLLDSCFEIKNRQLIPEIFFFEISKIIYKKVYPLLKKLK
jgi:hypothetical protein